MNLTILITKYRQHTSRHMFYSHAPFFRRLELTDVHLLCEDRICVKAPGDKTNCEVQGLEVMHDGRIIVADRSNRNIKLFDRCGDYLSSYHVTDCLFDYFFITTTDDGEIILSLTIEKDLRILGIERNRIRLRDTIRVQEDYGLVLACEDKIIAFPIFGTTVSLLDRGGNILWTKSLFHIDEFAREPVLYRVLSATCFLEGNKHVILLPDLCAKRIIKLDAQTGDIINISDDETMRSISLGIAVDKLGFVYVGFGLQGEIRAFTPDFTEQKKMLPWTAGFSSKLIKYDATNSRMVVSVDEEDCHNTNFIRTFNVVYNNRNGPCTSM